MKKFAIAALVLSVLLAGIGYAVIKSKVTLDSANQKYAKGDYAAAYRDYTVLATQNSPAAIHNLGLMYHTGKYVEEDHDRAFQCFLQAAQKGHPEAQYNTAICYMTGDGVKQSQEQSLVWTTRAAENKLPIAVTNLACAYLNAEGVPQDIPKGFAMLKQSADDGENNAQFKIGQMYLEGTFSAPQDSCKAVYYLTMAGQNGNSEAKAMLGILFFAGNRVPQDIELAKKILWDAYIDDQEPLAMAFWLVYADRRGKKEIAQKLLSELTDKKIDWKVKVGEVKYYLGERE